MLHVGAINDRPWHSHILGRVVRLPLVLQTRLMELPVMLSPRLLLSHEERVLVCLFVLISLQVMHVISLTPISVDKDVAHYYSSYNNYL